MNNHGLRFYQSDVGEAWALVHADTQALEAIQEELLGWRMLVRSGHALLALGAAVNFIEGILDREIRACGVRIGWTVRPDLMEGVSADLGISDEGISLSVWEYVPTGQGMGCDHQTLLHTLLDCQGGFDPSAISEWLEHVRIVKGKDARFEAEILGLPEY